MNAFDLGARDTLTKRASILRRGKKKPQDNVLRTTNNVTAGAALGVAGGIASQSTLGAVGSAGIAKTIQPSDVHLADAMLQGLKSKMGVGNTHHVFINDWRGSRAMLTPKGVAWVEAPTRGAEFMAHELGHAAQNKSKLWRHANITGRKYGPLAGMLAGGAMIGYGDEGSVATRAAPFVTAAGFMPMLADEAAASIRGIRGLKRMGVSGKQLNKARINMLKAFGTYGAMAAAGTLPIAALSAYRWNKKQQGKKKRA